MRVTDRVIDREPAPAWRVITEWVGERGQPKEQGAVGEWLAETAAWKIMQSVFNRVMREVVRCASTDAPAMPKKSEGGHANQWAS
jgi:hypothetical protein